jgi:uncharacterized protein YjeT (DUF2065 family)
MKKIEAPFEISSASAKRNDTPVMKLSKFSVREIVMGIVVAGCGVLVIFANNYMAKIAYSKLSKGTFILGVVIIIGGALLFLFGLFYRRLAKRAIKKQTGASQLIETDEGEIIEVHEEDPKKFYKK